MILLSARYHDLYGVTVTVLVGADLVPVGSPTLAAHLKTGMRNSVIARIQVHVLLLLVSLSLRQFISRNPSFKLHKKFLLQLDY